MIAIQEILQIKDVKVKVEARHACLEVRGIAQIGSKTITEEGDGIFKATQ